MPPPTRPSPPGASISRSAARIDQLHGWRRKAIPGSNARPPGGRRRKYPPPGRRDTRSRSGWDGRRSQTGRPDGPREGVVFPASWTRLPAEKSRTRGEQECSQERAERRKAAPRLIVSGRGRCGRSPKGNKREADLGEAPTSAAAVQAKPAMDVAQAARRRRRRRAGSQRPRGGTAERVMARDDRYHDLGRTQCVLKWWTLLCRRGRRSRSGGNRRNTVQEEDQGYEVVKEKPRQVWDRCGISFSRRMTRRPELMSGMRRPETYSARRRKAMRAGYLKSPLRYSVPLARAHGHVEAVIRHHGIELRQGPRWDRSRPRR